jgi:hypothetical protein
MGALYASEDTGSTFTTDPDASKWHFEGGTQMVNRADKGRYTQARQQLILPKSNLVYLETDME